LCFLSSNSERNTKRQEENFAGKIFSEKEKALFLMLQHAKQQHEPAKMRPVPKMPARQHAPAAAMAHFASVSGVVPKPIEVNRSIMS
jgi:hypothetical protein